MQGRPDRSKKLTWSGLSLYSFNDQEIVALSGAHAMGRCHTGECHGMSSTPSFESGFADISGNPIALER
jgi:catalase (peroxidase I)